MDREIKRLLKLSSIPNFKLTEHEQAILDEWKSTNEVKEEEKETGKLEVEHLQES